MKANTDRMKKKNRCHNSLVPRGNGETKTLIERNDERVEYAERQGKNTLDQATTRPGLFPKYVWQLGSEVYFVEVRDVVKTFSGGETRGGGSCAPACGSNLAGFSLVRHSYHGVAYRRLQYPNLAGLFSRSAQ